jgi:translation initiation factor IF-1
MDAVDTTAVAATATDPEDIQDRETTGGPRNRLPLSFTLWRLRFRLVPELPLTGGNGRCPIRPMKETPVEVEGVIHTVPPGTMFRVQLDNQHLALATISGKMRKRWVRLTVGDRVKMEMSPYDLDKARIVWRLK